MSQNLLSKDHHSDATEKDKNSTSHLVHTFPVLPITALALVNKLLLAGEGPLLKIYDVESHELLCTQRTPGTENIHGIKANLLDSCDDGNAFTEVLVWAGRSVSLLEVRSSQSSSSQLDLAVNFVIEAHANDWILDASFLPAASRSADDNAVDAVFLTSQNSLFSLRIPHNKSSDSIDNACMRFVASGSRSLLYSAHISWLLDGRGLVAAGTVFGEVFVWSFSADEKACTSPHASASQLHYVFIGHEGSVFGVRIFESTDGRRFVASCSDDRTIRIWDATDLGPQPAQGGGELRSRSIGDREGNHGMTRSTKACVASTMGHISRIWGIHFPSAEQEHYYLLSSGEDATTQIWRLGPLPAILQFSGSPTPLPLQHCSTHGFHSGKNMWAVAIDKAAGSGVRIATGGADGRIATYAIRDLGSALADNAWQRTYNMAEVCSHVTPKVKARRLFAALKGEWKLQRSLTSVIPTYPSGTLEGTATFQERSPTDASYDQEYLYNETGKFVTQQGFTLSASRRYVYRFEARTGQISAWFVKTEDGESVDYLFHVLDFGPSHGGFPESSENSTEGCVIANSHHLCIEDDYHADYTFSTLGTSIASWSVKYTVKGPKKDYISDSHYRRDDISASSVTNDDPPSRGDIGALASDSFKTYTWINQNSFLVTTGAGWLLLATISNADTSQDSSSISWDPVDQVDDLRGTCLTASVQNTDLVLLTGSNGKIYLYKEASQSLKVVAKLSRKVAYLHASIFQNSFTQPCSHGHKILIFASCLSSSTAWCIYLNISSGIENFRHLYFDIDLPAGFITTSANFIHQDEQNTLILGSRAGGIAIYKTNPESPPPSAARSLMLKQASEEAAQQGPNALPMNICPSFHYAFKCQSPHVHASESITSITTLPSTKTPHSNDSIYILTTGRNSAYSIHLITPSSFQTLHTSTPPFGPNIEGAYLSSTSTPSLYLYGFRSTSFIVYNATAQQEVMSIECGGAHRNWAYVPLPESDGGGRFIYTKASTLHIHSQSEASHKVIQAGGHGREIKAVAVSPPLQSFEGESDRYIATGAEDTCIRIWSYKAEELKSTHTVSKHITGIQALHWSSNGQYLFSAAGREEFFVWRVQPLPLPGLEVGVVCVSQCPAVTEAGDLRIMDFEILEVREDAEATRRFLVSLVYSDSSVRIFCLDVETRSWTLLSEGRYTDYCLTQVGTMHLEDRLYLCTASTDGHVALWPLNARPDQDNQGSDLEHVRFKTDKGRLRLSPSLTYNARFKVHQNCITDLSTDQLPSGDTLLATIGDDGALAFSRIALAVLVREEAGSLQHDPSPNISPQISILLIPKAHAAAATALQYLGCKTIEADKLIQYHFVTASNDQKVKTWVLSVDLGQPRVEGFTVSKGNNLATAIADVSSMDRIEAEDEDTAKVVIAGIGLEIRSMEI